ncbi:ribonuclease P protein component [Mucilaginibacter lacusdianchii]|uniref:ribonuclease P protein component n=1 Tax=Mucilaginibacter lacusdianchii TaxID=2684211 RepID=UPI001E4B35C7|nr:ribonuclease P protein component [Mucilaginibacter sp. JXJ CY 39]
MRIGAAYFDNTVYQSKAIMYTFKKEERLCNKKLIDGLFRSGSSFLCYPYRISWMEVSTPQSTPVQVLLAVAKKRYKRAVDRNLVKRRMREAYRVHKQELLYQHLQQKHIILSISYIGNEITDYSFMEKKMQKMLHQLNELVNAKVTAAV